MKNRSSELTGFIRAIEDVDSIKLIYKKSGKTTQEDLSEGGTLVNIPAVRMIPDEGTEIRLVASLGNWADDPKYVLMDLYLDQLADEIHSREVNVTLDAVKEGAQPFRATNNQELLDRIQEAERWIKDNGLDLDPYADTIVMNPLLASDLEVSGKISRIYLRDTPQSNFVGILRGKRVYWLAEILKNEILLYVKHEVAIQRTQLNIDFDRIRRPTKLVLSERLVAWKIDPKSSARITLN